MTDQCKQRATLTQSTFIDIDRRLYDKVYAVETSMSDKVYLKWW